MTATLDPRDDQIVLINTFTVRPEKADDLLALLDRATDEVMRHLPGFVSANLHLGQDRTRVANYAQWESLSDFEAMQRNPEAQAHMKEAAALAESFDPQLYRLRSSHGAESDLPDALTGPVAVPV